MRFFRGIILVLIALVPLVTLAHRDDRGRWDVQRSAMAAPDEFSYLLMGRNFLEGGGLSLEGQVGEDTFYPPGYSMILAAWAACVNGGQLTAFAAHACNAAMLSGAAILAYFLARRLFLAMDFRAGAAANLGLLIAGVFVCNWHVLDTGLVVMSEPAFMVVTFGWLLAALRWGDWDEHAGKAAGVALLATLAWTIRGAGITCVAATAVYAAWRWWKGREIEVWRRVAVMGVIVLLPVLYQVILAAYSPNKSLTAGHTSSNSYPRQLLGGLADRDLEWAVLSHLNDYAESFVPWLREEPDQTFRGIIGKAVGALGLAGFLAFLLVVKGKGEKGTSEGLVIIYILFYVGLYLLWPFNAARFWVPLLPLMLVLAFFSAIGFSSKLCSVNGLRCGVGLWVLLLVLHVEEDVVQLGNRARRLNYVSDSLADSMRAIARRTPDSSRLVIAGMGSDERFLAAWYYRQGDLRGKLPELQAPRGERADDMLLRLLEERGKDGRELYFLNYFPGRDARDTLESLEKRRPGVRIEKIFQKEIIVSVWKISP